MPRPYRPNPVPGAPRGKDGRRKTHVQQETRAEAKARKRAEAEARNALTLPRNRKVARKRRQAKGLTAVLLDLLAGAAT
jgi:hypothetical protein